jgi:proteasome lid subunit RPN8/RPN11
LLLLRPVLQAIQAQALAERPNECCGLLAGYASDERTGEAIATHCFPLVNEAASPREFLSEPRSLFAAMREIHSQELKTLAVYHSHPDTDPVPSRLDIERHVSPDVMALIISLVAGTPCLRAWWIHGPLPVEAQWAVLNHTAGPP